MLVDSFVSGDVFFPRDTQEILPEEFDLFDAIYDDKDMTETVEYEESDVNAQNDHFGNILIYFAGQKEVEMTRKLLHAPFRNFVRSRFWKNPDENMVSSSNNSSSCVVIFL